MSANSVLSINDLTSSILRRSVKSVNPQNGLQLRGILQTKSLRITLTINKPLVVAFASFETIQNLHGP